MGVNRRSGIGENGNHITTTANGKRPKKEKKKEFGLRGIYLAINDYKITIKK
jgi:hypothetical protein